MVKDKVIDPDHATCQAVIGLARDVEGCLRAISKASVTPPKPNGTSSAYLTFRNLLDDQKDKGTFSDWWGLSGAVKTRNRIAHPESDKPDEPPLTLPEVERAKASLENALRDLIANPSLPHGLREKISAKLDRAEKPLNSPGPGQSEPPLPEQEHSSPSDQSDSQRQSRSRSETQSPDATQSEQPRFPQLIHVHLSTSIARRGLWAIFAVLVISFLVFIFRPSAVQSVVTISNQVSAPTSALQQDASIVKPPVNGVLHQNPVPDAAPKPLLFASLVNHQVNLSTSQRNVALVIDAPELIDATQMGDLVNGFLNDQKVRTILNMVDLKALRASRFFDDFYAANGPLLREAAQVSGVDYVLLGKAEYKFRKQTALDPDLITCDLTFRGRLADRQGTIVQSAMFSTAGPGFTETQALEKAAENAARQLSSRFFEKLP